MSSTAMIAALERRLAPRPHRPLHLVELSPHASSPAAVFRNRSSSATACSVSRSIGRRGSRMSTTETSRFSRSSLVSSAITRSSAASALRLGKLHHLAAVEHEVPAPLALPHQPADPRADRPRLGEERQRLGNRPVGAGAGDQRQVGPAQAAVDLGDAHPVLRRAARARRRQRQTTTGTRSIARISSTPLASARTRTRSTASSCSMRSRTAATSSSRLDTGSCTKAATRIASARSRLTSGTAIGVDDELRPVHDRLAHPLDRRQRAGAQVELGRERPGGGDAGEHRHPEVDQPPEALPQPEPVQLVAQPRRRRVAAGRRPRGGLHREHEASSTIQRTSAPKEMPAVRRLLGRERGRGHARLGVDLEQDQPGEPARLVPAEVGAADAAAAERPVRARGRSRGRPPRSRPGCRPAPRGASRRGRTWRGSRTSRRR